MLIFLYLSKHTLGIHIILVKSYYWSFHIENNKYKRAGPLTKTSPKNTKWAKQPKDAKATNNSQSIHHYKALVGAAGVQDDNKKVTRELDDAQKQYDTLKGIHENLNMDYSPRHIATPIANPIGGTRKTLVAIADRWKMFQGFGNHPERERP